PPISSRGLERLGDLGNPRHRTGGHHRYWGIRGCQVRLRKPFSPLLSLRLAITEEPTTVATNCGRLCRFPSSPEAGQSTTGFAKPPAPCGSHRKCDSVRPEFSPSRSSAHRSSAG